MHNMHSFTILSVNNHQSLYNSRMKCNKFNYDTILVGAGSAGCLLANRLSADPNHKVLFIETGGQDDWIWIKS